ncbi:MAG: DUF6152 family protein [Rhodospirillaceae bacterium]
MLTRRSFTLGILGTPILAKSAFAHHGFTGIYDSERPIYVAGEVIEATFRRPHPVIELRVDSALQAPANLPKGEEFAEILEVRAEDRGRIIEIEYPPIGLFFNLSDRIAVGDWVATIVYQNCRPPHQLRGQWLRLVDGETVVRRGRMQTEDAGCSG